jgi:hypothetical protein
MAFAIGILILVIARDNSHRRDMAGAHRVRRYAA